jgi:hypothetical protein
MILRGFLLCAVTCLVIGCPKHVPTTVSGSDDDQVDQDASKLEELRTRAQGADIKCADWCQMSKVACEISKRVCEIAGRHVDRQDLQSKCGNGQEDCAQYNDRCAACSR